MKILALHIVAMMLVVQASVTCTTMILVKITVHAMPLATREEIAAQMSTVLQVSSYSEINSTSKINTF